nr:4255_t:CDS:2 [Entrophospora candida]CAG8554023.1 7764_t:CDS:2 [Entrophospora candida]
MTKKSNKDSQQKTVEKNNDNETNKSPISLLSEKTYKMNLLIKPGAKESRVTNISEVHVGLQIAAPPRDGEANKEVISFLSEILRIRKSDISLISGMKSRDKIVKLEGITHDEILNLLKSNIQ